MRRPSLRWLPSPRQPGDDPEHGTSIARRLRWTLLLSSVVPLLIVGVLLIGLNAGFQQRSVYNDQIDLATRVERDISRYVDDLHTQLDRFAPVGRFANHFKIIVALQQQTQTRAHHR